MRIRGAGMGYHTQTKVIHRDTLQPETPWFSLNTKWDEIKSCPSPPLRLSSFLLNERGIISTKKKEPPACFYLSKTWANGSWLCSWNTTLYRHCFRDPAMTPHCCRQLKNRRGFEGCFSTPLHVLMPILPFPSISSLLYKLIAPFYFFFFSIFFSCFTTVPKCKRKKETRANKGQSHDLGLTSGQDGFSIMGDTWGVAKLVRGA